MTENRKQLLFLFLFIGAGVAWFFFHQKSAPNPADNNTLDAAGGAIDAQTPAYTDPTNGGNVTLTYNLGGSDGTPTASELNNVPSILPLNLDSPKLVDNYRSGSSSGGCGGNCSGCTKSSGSLVTAQTFVAAITPQQVQSQTDNLQSYYSKTMV